MHTEGGIDMIRHFLVDIAGCKADWTMDQVLEEQLKKIADVVRGPLGVGGWLDYCSWDGRAMHEVLEEQLKKIADVSVDECWVGVGVAEGWVVGAARRIGRWIKCWRSR